MPVNGGVHSSVRVSSCCVATYSWVKKWLQIGGVCNYWTGIWNGGCTVTGAVVQGCASYCVSRAVISPQRLYERVQCCQHSSLYSILIWCHGQNLGSPRLATVPCMGTKLTVRRLLLSLVYPDSAINGWDLGVTWESRCTDEDWSEKTGIEH